MSWLTSDPSGTEVVVVSAQERSRWEAFSLLSCVSRLPELLRSYILSEYR